MKMSTYGAIASCLRQHIGIGRYFNFFNNQCIEDAFDARATSPVSERGQYFAPERRSLQETMAPECADPLVQAAMKNVRD
jgi:hypothetical protein